MTRTFSRAGVLSINPPVLSLHGIVFLSVAVTAVKRHCSRELFQPAGLPLVFFLRMFPQNPLQCFDAVGWGARRASGL